MTGGRVSGASFKWFLKITFCFLFYAFNVWIAGFMRASRFYLNRLPFWETKTRQKYATMHQQHECKKNIFDFRLADKYEGKWNKREKRCFFLIWIFSSSFFCTKIKRWITHTSREKTSYLKTKYSYTIFDMWICRRATTTTTGRTLWSLETRSKKVFRSRQNEAVLK